MKGILDPGKKFYRENSGSTAKWNKEAIGDLLGEESTFFANIKLIHGNFPLFNIRNILDH